MANNQIALLARVPEFDTPFESQGKALQLRALMHQAQTQDMDMDQRRRALADDSAQRDIYARYDNPADRIRELYRTNPKAAMAAEKAQVDLEKARADAGKDTATAGKTKQETIDLRMKRARDLLGTVNDRDTASTWVRGLYSDPDIGPVLTQHLGPVETTVGRIPDPVADPQGFAQWKQASQLSADKLVEMTTPDANARLQSDTSKRNTDVQASTSRRNTDVTVAQSERSSQRSDARARDTNNVQREAQQTQVIIDPNLGPILVNKGTKTAVAATFADGTRIPGENVVKAKKLNEQLKAGIALAKDLIPKATASGAGALMDKGAAFFGGSTEGSEAASQLKTLGGWMTANVPRMEGPQSNFDVQQYQMMAADVGNDTLPAARRLAALSTLEKLYEKYADINNATAKPTAPGKPGTVPNPMTPGDVIDFGDLK